MIFHEVGPTDRQTNRQEDWQKTDGETDKDMIALSLELTNFQQLADSQGQDLTLGSQLPGLNIFSLGVSFQSQDFDIGSQLPGSWFWPWESAPRVMILTLGASSQELIILCRKIAISPEPNLRWTSDQSVNSSLSVAVQEKKTRALYLSRLKRGGPMKFENTFFQIAKLRFS